jgi:hypothetical protein
VPSRTATVAIIAIWLFTAGWMIVRDLLPAWRSGDPPPYTIELADEALPTVVPTRWTCTINGVETGTVLTSLAYKPDDDTFELAAKSEKLRLFSHIAMEARKYEDRVRVTRDGELRSMRVHATVALAIGGLDFTGRIALSAEVQHGRLERHLLLESPGIGQYAPTLESTDPPRGSVLNPMNPVPRIKGLQPGQSWRQPLSDPRIDILQAAAARSGVKMPFLPEAPKFVIARVLPKPQPLLRNTAKTLCLVIEYRGGDDFVAKTWVQVVNGDVVCQEAEAYGEKWALTRD